MRMRDKILYMLFGVGNLTLIYVFLAVTACFCILSLSCEKNKPKTQKGRINETSLAKTKIGADGAQMVLIPAGQFQMGSKDGADDEKPVHQVTLDAFYIDVNEVTVKQYKKFVSVTGHIAPNWSEVSQSARTNDHPMTGVTWDDAMAYAIWAGKRLPTEAEWEYAARGGVPSQKYPWGNQANPTLATYSVAMPTPIGSHQPNKYGLYDLAGNVYEWCLDEYEKNYYKSSPKRNPICGRNMQEFNKTFSMDRKKLKGLRVLRGGSWTSSAELIRVTSRSRFEPTAALHDFGFRCVESVKPNNQINWNADH